jgi:hypothetical protein
MSNVQQMLMEVEADIAHCDAELERQRELIADMQFRGQSSAFAKGILKELKSIRAKQRALCDELRAEAVRRAWLDQDLRAADSCPSSERM